MAFLLCNAAAVEWMVFSNVFFFAYESKQALANDDKAPRGVVAKFARSHGMFSKYVTMVERLKRS